MKPDRVTKDAKDQEAKGKDEPDLPSPKRSSGFAQAGHAGHRQRLKARFLKGGAEALPDYEMLELLLFQALPRRDTKRLAKALLKRFGSFPEVISAEPGALKEIDSIGDGDIGHAIQSSAEAKRYSVVRDFCGHGLGQVFHDAPNVMHYGKAGQGDALREGMFFTIEPMINTGGYEVKILGDGWTAVTKDRSLSAQFEHSIGVTADGYELFTLSPAGLDRPPYET